MGSSNGRSSPRRAAAGDFLTSSPAERVGVPRGVLGVIVRTPDIGTVTSLPLTSTVGDASTCIVLPILEICRPTLADRFGRTWASQQGSYFSVPSANFASGSENLVRGLISNGQVPG